MKETQTGLEGDLLSELQRLNKTGVINDEEFLALRKIIRGGAINEEFRGRFAQLFGAKPKIEAGKTTVCEKEKYASGSAAKTKSAENAERLYSMSEAIDELGFAALADFDYSRELLSCPACGLFEHIGKNGKLIVAEPDYPGDDTGLRFVKKQNTEIWECPDCGHCDSV